MGGVCCQWSSLVACIGNSDQILTTVPKGDASCKNGRMGENQVEFMSKAASSIFPLGKF